MSETVEAMAWAERLIEVAEGWALDELADNADESLIDDGGTAPTSTTVR